jgi:hypothetical protein
MNKLTKTQHVKNIIKDYPTMSAKDIALRANCDVALVYVIKKAMRVEQTSKDITSDLVYEVTKGRKDKLQPPEVSIKKACEVLVNLVKDVDGLDIMLFDATIRLDWNGEGFECASDEVESIVKAIKLLEFHSQ